MTNQPTKLCPFCAEEILNVAVKCKHCKADLASPSAADASQQCSPAQPEQQQAKLEYGKRSCPKCGLSVPVYIKKCPGCQTDLDPGCLKTTGGCILFIIGIIIIAFSILVGISGLMS